MPTLASESLIEAQALLHDSSGVLYTNAKLIPLMQKAYRELQLKMQLNGLPVMKEKSTVITVSAGTTRLGDGAGLPADFVLPIDLEERAPGSTELWSPMTELAWEPNLSPGPSLVYWNFREEEVKFLGATADREVRMTYQKGLTRITSDQTPIAILNSTTYLASRTAAIAAYVLGENPTRSEALNGDAGQAMHELIALLVKRQQGLPVRRRVNRYRR